MHDPTTDRSALPVALPRGDDPHDRTLREHVRPTAWPVLTPRTRYDLVVLGGGPAGLVAARGLAALGGRVALVERALLGGDCLNVGCVPSKALRHAARHAARGGSADDFAAVMRGVRERRARIASHDAATALRDEGVDVFFAAGRFVGPREIAAGTERLRFRHALVATGAGPALPDVPGLSALAPRTNETIFDLVERPRRLLVLGAGPVGCELAQAFRRLGCDVALAASSERLLPRDDPDAAAILQRRFEQEGIALHLGARVRGGEVRAGRSVVHLERDGAPFELSGDEVLAALGRRPNVTGLGLELVGIAFDERDGIRVDDRLRTTHSRVWAAGDCTSALRFTHAADAQARLVLRNAFFFGRARASRLVIPWCTYTDPEVAHVGWSAAEAARRGVAFDTFDVPFEALDRAVVERETEGFARVHVVRGGDRILGATVCGESAGELIGTVAFAMARAIGLRAFASTVFPYPTRGEVWRRLGDQAQRARLTPRIARWLGAVLRWGR